MFCSHMLKRILDRAESWESDWKYNSAAPSCFECGLSVTIKEEKWNIYFLPESLLRPFLVFTKEVREAIFDILLAISEFVVKERNIEVCAKRLSEKILE